MSIVTKTGDNGTTGLMYNRRISKTHPRVEAYGAVDELNAALGMARATSEHEFIKSSLLAIQKELVAVMGEMATMKEDLARYEKDGYQIINASHAARLDEIVKVIEAQKVSFRGWATPGDSIGSAALDVARTTCRRAERRVCGLMETGEMENGNILIYLNRLSDLLWLMARWVETQSDETRT